MGAWYISMICNQVGDPEKLIKLINGEHLSDTLSSIVIERARTKLLLFF